MQKLIPGFLLVAAFVLSACGGGASNSPNENPNGTGTGGGGPAETYTGPNPQNDDIQNFKIQFFDNVRGDDRCGTCHSPDATGNPGSAGSDFANNNDVNAAYAVAIGLVDANDIPNSAFARKFTGDGHFCWEGTQNACKIQIELWISNWLNGTGGAGGRAINLTPPNDENPAPATIFDPNVDASYYTGNGGANIHTLVATNCSGCHVPNPTQSAQPINPQFAVGTIGTLPGGQASYDIVSAQNLINLNTTALSRLYTRLNTDGHNCWDAGNGVSCPDSAALMLSAIDFYRDTIQAASPPDYTELNSMVKSRAVELFADGIVASGGNRYEANQIALYEFKTGSGTTIVDVSGVSPSVNLELTGIEGTDYEWQGSYGMKFNTGAAKAQSETDPANKLQQLISSTGEYSVEMWLVPGSVADDNTTIVSYEFNTNLRNFMIGQDMYAYESYNRNAAPATGADATPRLLTDGDDDAATSLQHVVVTYDQNNGRQIYVNGTVRTLADPDTIDNLTNWATGYSLVVGNDTANGRAWNGTMRLLSIHNRALTSEQILQNFDIGVGQKYFLMFEISEHIPQCQGDDPNLATDDPVRDPDYRPLCYVYLEAAQFDNNSFLFAYPRFVTLSDTVTQGGVTQPLDVNGVRIRNMRIGINGREASNGQGFANIDVTLANYDHAVGQELSNIGTIVASENGPAPQAPLTADKFFLTFELLGTTTPTKDYTENFPATPDVVTPGVTPLVSVRSFEQINASMAAMTTVSRTTSTVNQNDVFDGTGVANDGTYTNVIQALPGTPDPSAFSSANQMAVTQLAIEYCNALVDNVDNPNPAPRDTYFPGVTFNGASSPNFSFSGAERDLIIEPLLTRMYNVDGATELSTTTMTPAATARTHLNTMIDSLTVSCGGQCGFSRTQTVIKATCAAALAGAPMLLQ